MKKKIVSIILSMALIVSLGACSGGSSNKEASVKKSQVKQMAEVKFPLDKEKEYSVFAPISLKSELSDNPVIKKTEEDDNIKLKFQSVMTVDLVEKRNLLLSSGDYPDIFYKSALSSADAEKYGKQGVFIPLEKLIKKYAPNLTAQLDKLDAWKDITAGDGHIYAIPGIRKPDVATPTFWIDKKWMDNLGLSEPKSLDELYQVLKAFKEKDANGNGDPNDEIPMTASDVVKPDLLLEYFGISYDYGTKLSVIDDKLQYVPNTDVFKKYVAYVTKLYQEGLLDKSAFTQKYEQQMAVGQSGDTLGSFSDAGSFCTVGRDNDDDYIALTPFDDHTYPIRSAIMPGTMAITDKCKNPEVMVAWADQFYTEEGGILAWLGIEGQSWEVRPDGTWGWIMGKGFGDDVASVRANATLQGAAEHPAYQPDYWYDKMSPDVDPDESYLNGERAKLVKKSSIPLPVLNFSEEDAAELATIKTDIDNYIDQYVAQVATGKKKLDGSWKEFQKTLKNMKADRMLEIYKKAYDKAKK